MLLDPLPTPADIKTLKHGDKIYLSARGTMVPAQFMRPACGLERAYVKGQAHGILLVLSSNIFHPDDVAKGIQK